MQHSVLLDQLTTIQYPVLALHGSAGLGKQWRDLQHSFNFTKGFYAPDLYGYGSNPIDNNIPALEEDTVRIEPLLKWLDAQALPVVIVAHSFGSTLAIELANLRPTAVKSLILYEPVVPAILKVNQDDLDRILLHEFSHLAHLMGIANAKIAIPCFINFWAGKTLWPDLPISHQTKLMQQQLAVHHDFCWAFSRPASNYIALSSSIHTAILVGTKTIPLATKMAIKVSKLNTNSVVVELPYCGHNDIFAKSNSVIPIIEKYLALQ